MSIEWWIVYILVNWICNCSLYNTLVLVVYIILLSEHGSEAVFCESRVVVKFRAFHAAGDSRSRGVRRDYLAFLAHSQRERGNTWKQTGSYVCSGRIWIVNLNFFTEKCTVGTVLDWTAPTNRYYRGSWNYNRPCKSIYRQTPLQIDL